MTRLDVTDPKNSTPAPLLEYRDVVKSYGQGDTEVVALRQIDLAVAAGEVVAIMGPSGYGKSTLLHLAGVLEAPRSVDRPGSWDDRRPDRRRSCG